MTCPEGEELDAGLCYKRCDEGYTGIGPVCWGNCSNNTTDIGAICNKKSYGRGVGTTPTECSADKEKDALLCYKKCETNYKGIGPICWGICPSGFGDAGNFCSKPKPYGRGGGHITKDICERSRDRGARTNGCERYGALWYPRCDMKYHNVGCCICSPDCPSGFSDRGEFCAKPSYGRGVGTPLDACDHDKEIDAGLCYKKCEPRYKGVGPICWGECGGETTDSGSFCTKKTYGRGVGTIPKYNYTWLWIILGIILAVIVFIIILSIVLRS